jgi:hypothetical protein
VDWEERIVEAWMLRCALRAETGVVREVVRGGRVVTLFLEGGDLVV